MVNPGLAIAALSFGLSMKDRAEEQEREDEMITGEDIHGIEPGEDGVTDGGQPSGSGSGDRGRRGLAERQRETREAVEKLLEHEKATEASPEDKDAYASAVLELGTGETGVVTVGPQEGYNLRVREIRFDRRTDHDYKLNVGGEVLSVAHKAVFSKPKLVTQSDRVIGEVTNNAGSASTVDFEMDAWAVPGNGGRS